MGYTVLSENKTYNVTYNKQTYNITDVYTGIYDNNINNIANLDEYSSDELLNHPIWTVYNENRPYTDSSWIKINKIEYDKFADKILLDIKENEEVSERTGYIKLKDFDYFLTVIQEGQTNDYMFRYKSSEGYYTFSLNLSFINLYHSDVISKLPSHINYYIDNMYIWSNSVSKTYSTSIPQINVTDTIGYNVFNIDKTSNQIKTEHPRIFNMVTDNYYNTIQYYTNIDNIHTYINNVININTDTNFERHSNRFPKLRLINDNDYNSAGINIRLAFYTYITTNVDVILYVDPIDIDIWKRESNDTDNLLDLISFYGSHAYSTPYTKLTNMSCRKSYQVNDKNYLDITIPANIENLMTVNNFYRNDTQDGTYFNINVVICIGCTVSSVTCDTWDGKLDYTI